MTRVKRGTNKKYRHKKVLSQTKGHQGVRHTLYRRAHESLIHALQYAYGHRRDRKGDMRRLWTVRINAAARLNATSYSQLIRGLRVGGALINRKMLAELATQDPAGFARVVEQAKHNLEATPA